MLISPIYLPSFIKTFERGNISYAIIRSNMNEYIESHKASLLEPFSFEKYQPLGNLEYKLEELERNHPNVMKRFVIGKSFEERNISGISLNLGGFSKNSTRPIVVFECGIHAREWISPASCLWVLDFLTLSRPEIVNFYEFQFIPVMNPDGYVYSWTTDRWWRKNRATGFGNASRAHVDLNSPTNLTNVECVGVDLNRNFESPCFCCHSGSADPCENIHCGSSAFDQPETKALAMHVQGIRDRLVAYFSIHSYGQLFLWPALDRMKHVQKNLKRLGMLAVGAIKARTGGNYRQGAPVSLSCEFTRLAN